jgi:anion transporter
MVFFVWGKTPVGVTAMLGAIAMAATGIIPYSDAFSAFGQDTVMMVIGMIAIANAMFETGCAETFGRTIIRIKGVGSNEKLFLVVIVTLASALSAFTSNTATVALFLPLISSIAAASGGKITKKNTYMAVGIASLVGGNMTLAGSTPQLVAQGILEASGGETMDFFTLFPGAFPSFILMLVYYLTFGYRLQQKVFRFDDVPYQAGNQEDVSYPKSKMIICALIFAGVVLCFVLNIATFGTVAIVGACLCVLTGCISMQRTFALMEWSSIMVLGGGLGIAEGLRASGAITLVAGKTLDILGGPDATPWAIAIAIALASSLLGNVMSHTATAAVMTPFVIELAKGVGVRPLTFVIIVVITCNICYATPMSTPPLTMTLTGGYRFKDYTLVGGALNIIALAVSAICIPLIYGF